MSIRRKCMLIGPPGAVYAWPPGTVVAWHVDPTGGLPDGVDLAAVRTQVARAVGQWTAACGVKADEVGDAAQARVLVKFGRIDGPYNVLGVTELPAEGRADARHTMTLDIGEKWTASWVYQVALHEFGHAIGVEHAPEGTIAVMAPVYNPTLFLLQPWDIEQARERYPLPPPAPTPDPAVSGPPPSEPGASSLTVYLDAPAAGRYLITMSVRADTSGTPG